MTEEIRPICLYIETCLDKKEGTRDCAKCEHHLNYWTEIMIRNMEKNITRLEQENFALTQESQQKSQTICELEQENKELKKQTESDKGLITVGGKQQYEMTMAYDKFKSALEEIQKAIKSYDLGVDNGVSVDTLYTIRKIINEVLG